MERLSVMASTADIQVRASRGRTTQELHRDALAGGEEGGVSEEDEIKAKVNQALFLFLLLLFFFSTPLGF